MARVSPFLREFVRQRANDTCEYCRMPQVFYRFPFQPDHIIADAHDGGTTASNLCWRCFHCNLHKGTNLSGIDSKTEKKAWLYNPRRMKWSRHFRWNGPVLIGRTPVGRATIEVLRMNDEDYVQTRPALIGEGVFPPEL
jgi:HNH endonuclease